MKTQSASRSSFVTLFAFLTITPVFGAVVAPFVYNMQVSQTTPGAPAPVSLGTSDFLDLIDQVVNLSDAQLNAFDPYDYMATVNYLGQETPLSLRFLT